MQSINITLLIIVGLCVTGFVTTIVLLIQMLKRQMSFLMSVKSDKDYQATEPTKIQRLAEEDMKKMQEETDYNDYRDILMRGEATPEEEERFGVADGVIR